METLAIVGVGLIGGSLALALREARACRRIIGVDRDQDSLIRAEERGMLDSWRQDLEEAAAEAEGIILAVPGAAVGALFRELAPRLRDTVVLTDVGSVKSEVTAVARQELGPRLPRFVPGHPIAGTERSGVDAAFPSLFRKHRVILTPMEETDAEAVGWTRAMWEAVGAQVTELSVEHHDEVLAATSHLPHLLAYALVDCLSGMRDREEMFQYAAGGFADFTRIASSDPKMWHDICFSNRKDLLAVLERFRVCTDTLRAAIERNDSEALLETFVRAKQARDRFEDVRKEQDS